MFIFADDRQAAYQSRNHGTMWCYVYRLPNGKQAGLTMPIQDRMTAIKFPALYRIKVTFKGKLEIKP